MIVFEVIIPYIPLYEVTIPFHTTEELDKIVTQKYKILGQEYKPPQMSKELQC